MTVGGGGCFAPSSLAMTVGRGDCFAPSSLAMTLRRSLPSHVIASLWEAIFWLIGSHRAFKSCITCKRGDCFAPSSLAMTVGGGDCFAPSSLAMTLRRSLPSTCHCEEPVGRQSNLLVDRIASGFQERYHIQERRLLRSFVARNDSGKRRLLRSFVARNDIGGRRLLHPGTCRRGVEGGLAMTSRRVLDRPFVPCSAVILVIEERL
jgi:hypothetical protein